MPEPKTPLNLDDLLAHRRWVRALAVRLTDDEATADDIEQETWLAAMRSRPRSIQSPRAWLGTVLRNAACSDSRRRERRDRHAAILARSSSPPVTSPEDIVAEAELQARLVRAVLDMHEPYRSTILFRFFHGLEAREIAERDALPIETVRTRVKRGLEQLRRRMDAELGDDRAAWCLLVLGHNWPDATVTGVGAGSVLAGGIVVATATKVMVTVAVLAGVVWWCLPGEGAAPPRGRATANAPEDHASEASRQTPARSGDDLRRRVEVRDGGAVGSVPQPSGPPTSSATGDLVVYGRVLDADTRAPVAGSTVALVWPHARRPSDEPSAVAQEDGSFEIRGVRENQYAHILLTADGYAETLHLVPWRYGLARTEKGDASDLLLYRGARVAGRVVGSDGHSAVADARICVSSKWRSSSRVPYRSARERGRSEDDGSFALNRVTPNERGYMAYAVASDGIGWTRLPRSTGKASVLDVEIRLRPTFAATVLVTDAKGRPQPNQWVLASPRFVPLGVSASSAHVSHEVFAGEGGPFDATFSIRTDAEGRARFSHLPVLPGGAIYDFITHGVGRAWRDGVDVRPGDDVTIEISVDVSRTWLLAGRVQSAAGEPVADAIVESRHGPGAVRTDAEGRFRLVDLPADRDRLRLDVVAEGFARVIRVLHADPQRDAVEAVIVLHRVAPIDGRVVDQNGDPVSGVEVRLRREHDEARDFLRVDPVATDAEGRFAFPGAAEGSWILSVESPLPFDEWVRPKGVVRGGDHDVIVVLRHVAPGKAHVNAEIVDAETGENLSAEEVDIVRLDQGNAATRRLGFAEVELGLGRVTMKRVRAGRWRLWVRVAGRTPAFADFDVADGQVAVPVQVTVRRSGTLRVEVDAAAAGDVRPPVMWIAAADGHRTPPYARYQNEHGGNMAIAQSDGSYVFERLPAMRYRVWTNVNGRSAQLEAEVLAGAETRVTMTLQTSSIISFQLSKPSPSGRAVFEISRDGSAWQVIREFVGSTRDGVSFDATVPGGSWQWRVSFPAGLRAGGSGLAAIASTVGSLVVEPGATIVVDVPVLRR